MIFSTKSEKRCCLLLSTQSNSRLLKLIIEKIKVFLLVSRGVENMGHLEEVGEERLVQD